MVEWRDLKNSKTKPIALVPHRSTSALDSYLAFFTAGTGGLFNEGGPAMEGSSKFVFHRYSKGSASAIAPKVTKIIQDLMPPARGAYVITQFPNLMTASIAQAMAFETVLLKTWKQMVLVRRLLLIASATKRSQAKEALAFNRAALLSLTTRLLQHV